MEFSSARPMLVVAIALAGCTENDVVAATETTAVRQSLVPDVQAYCGERGSPPLVGAAAAVEDRVYAPGEAPRIDFELSADAPADATVELRVRINDDEGVQFVEFPVAFAAGERRMIELPIEESLRGARALVSVRAMVRDQMGSVYDRRHVTGFAALKEGESWRYLDPDVNEERWLAGTKDRSGGISRSRSHRDAPVAEDNGVGE